jgi:hypothetical protein
LRTISVNLLPQPADVDIHEIRAGIKIILPDAADDVTPADDTTLRLQQALQEQPLTPGELHAPTGAACLTGGRIIGQIRDREDDVLCGGMTTQQGAQTGQQLRDGKGLGQIVIRACVQALHALLHLTTGGEHDDRGDIPETAQLTHETEAVPERKHDVHEEGIPWLTRGALQAALPIRHDLDLKAILAEPTSRAAVFLSSSTMRIFMDNQGNELPMIASSILQMTAFSWS